MITIKKKYHFYAAHRNETIQDKCRNIHGHTYYVTCFFGFTEPTEASGVTMLFGEIDKVVEPIIKAWDHSLLMHLGDPFYKCLISYRKETGEHMNTICFNYPTSAENVAKRLFDIILCHLPIIEIHLQETTSSTVIYKP